MAKLDFPLHITTKYKWYIKYLLFPFVDTLYMIEQHFNVKFVDDDKVQKLALKGAIIKFTRKRPNVDVEF